MTFEAYVQGFGCLPSMASYERAVAAILPIPLEWGRGEIPGVGLGPMAVLGASRYLETYDTDLDFDPMDRAIATLDPPELSYDSSSRPFEQIREHIEAVHSDGKRVICIGGDRVLAIPAVQAAQSQLGRIGVVIISRRPGVLDRDHGRTISPLTLGRRLSEIAPTAIIGPRWWSAAEAEYLRGDEAPLMISAREVAKLDQRLGDVHHQLPPRVHLAVDVGVLAPAHLPMTGNVEPGGLDWYELIDLLDVIFQSFSVVACDVSGFVPAIGQVAPSLLVAQLVLRCLGRMT